MFFKVDVQPLAPRIAGGGDTGCDEPPGDAAPTMRTGDDRVQDDGVPGSVSSHVHPPDQRRVITGTDPAEAVPLNLTGPIPLTRLSVEALGVQQLHLATVESASPRLLDHVRIVRRRLAVQQSDTPCHAADRVPSLRAVLPM